MSRPAPHASSADRPLWSAGDPRLQPTADLAVARATLAAYAPRDAAQRALRERMLAFVDAHPADAHLRALLEGHLTASALVVDRARGKALLTHHKKLDAWLQLGGHCDGDANLAACALREASEESGIADLAVDPLPIDLDVHPIPERPGEPRHFHYDTRFLVVAPDHARETASAESHRLGWFGPEELGALAVDDSVRRLFELAFR